MQEQTYTTKSIDHLGLVAALCKELKIAEFIDQQVPTQSSTRNISYGQLVVAMLLNGLGFVGRTLHMYPDYFSDKPIERLIGDGIEATHINDDVLGRCLDKLYELDVSTLYQSLSEQVVSHLKLPCDSVHLDSTSFHVDGAYECDDEAQCIQLTKGYSRDHRPELNQVILNLITENQAGIPVYMQACSGTTNDSESFKKLVKSHITSLKSAQDCKYFVGDAALYVAETIQSLSEQKKLFITRVPQKLVEAKKIIAAQSDYELTDMGDGYSGKWFDAEYAGIQQKWLLIKSEQAHKRECHHLNKRLLKLGEGSMKDFKRLCRQSFTCETDAEQALLQWKKKHSYVEIADSDIVSKANHQGRGRPASKASVETTYSISGKLYCSLSTRSKEEEKKGLFILATNDCSEGLDMQMLLTYYKAQQSVEKGFRFLKSPDFLTSSIYLKKPERVEALLMIMTTCLMVYAALEHLIRKKLKEKNLFFIDTKKKPTQKPTARWVFFCFQGIHQLTIDKRKTVVLNLRELHETILNCLGVLYREIYS